MKKVIVLILTCITVLLALCDALPLPTENIIEVSPGDDIRSIVLNAAEGSTIIFNSGHYRVNQTIFVNQDNITLISKAQHRDSVLLDGNSGGTPLVPSTFTNEIVALRGNNITVAHISICHARDHGIHAYPSSSAAENKKGLHLYDIRVFDCGQQLIKVNSNGNVDNLHWIDEGVLECSLIEFVDNSVMEEHSDYFYTGGIDIHGGENWTIRHNTFRNIERDATLMEHAIHFWSKSRGTLIENNRFINVYRAIGLGMKTVENGAIERHYADQLGDSPYFDHIHGIIRNNVLYNESGIHLESGIELMNVHNVQVYNNTIFSEDQPFNSLEYRWPNTTVTIKNNLFSHNIMPRNDAQGILEANLQNVSADLFLDISNHDFHLISDALSAIGTGAPLHDSLFGSDIDGEKAGNQIDIGADQIGTNSTLKSNKSSDLITIQQVQGRILLHGLSTLSNITLYTLAGQKLIQKSVIENSLILPESVSPGVYLLVVSSGTISCKQKIRVP